MHLGTALLAYGIGGHYNSLANLDERARELESVRVEQRWFWEGESSPPRRRESIQPPTINRLVSSCPPFVGKHERMVV